MNAAKANNDPQGEGDGLVEPPVPDAGALPGDVEGSEEDDAQTSNAPTVSPNSSPTGRKPNAR